MTITAFDIYLVSLADKFLGVTLVGIFLSVLVCVVALVAITICYAEEKKNAKKWLARGAVSFLIALGLFALVPNSKTIAAMYLVPAVVNNKHLQNSAGNALEMLEELTKKWLKDITKQKGEREVEVEVTL